MPTPRRLPTSTTWYRDVSRLGGGLNQRAGDRERRAAVLGGVAVVNGSFEMEPLQAEEIEVVVGITFPVRFLGDRTEVPTITGSGVLADGERPTAGQLPKFHVCAANLTFQESPGGSRTYSACDLLVVVSGHVGMRSIATWQATGRALVNPDSGANAPGVIG